MSSCRIGEKWAFGQYGEGFSERVLHCWRLRWQRQFLIGCGPSALRAGPTVPLPSGPARDPAKAKAGMSLRPRASRPKVRPQGCFTAFTITDKFNGLGVFRPGVKEAEELEDVWPRLNEPRLQQLHEARIEPADAAERHSVYWAPGGLVGMAGGLAGAAALGDSHPTAAAVSGISGLTMGLVGVVGALVAQPSGQEQLEAEARRKLFFFPQDDRAAVERGVDRGNLATRESCAR